MEVKITLLLAASLLLHTSPTFTATILKEEFPYYKLALQWPYSVCNNVGRVPCSKPWVGYQRFLIHGLWPSRKSCPAKELTSDSQVTGPIRGKLQQCGRVKHGRCFRREPASVYSFNYTIDVRNRFLVLVALGGEEEIPYYKLALQWPNSVCNVRRSVPCLLNKPWVDYQSFLIHGLWPFRADKYSILPPCPGNELTRSQVQGIEDKLQQYWPDLLHPDDFGFWKWQWEKHGRCLTVEPSKYFNDAIELFELVTNMLKSLGGEGCRPRSDPYKRIDIYNALSRALGGKHGQLICNWRHDKYQLVEVHICFDSQKNLCNCPFPYINCGNDDQVSVLFPTSETASN